MTFRPFRLSLNALLAALLVASALPAAAEPTLAEVQASMKQGQLPAALEKVDQILAVKPKDAPARFTKGIILTEMNRQNDAIALYQKLSEDYPELPEPYNNLAVIYASQRQYEKAKAALEMAIRTHPAYATAHENLGDVYAKLASQAYDKALQLDSANTQAQTKLAVIRDLMGSNSRVPRTAPPSKPVLVAAAPAAAPAAAAKAPAKTPETPAAAKPAPATPVVAKAEPEKLPAKPAAEKAAPVPEKKAEPKPDDKAQAEARKLVENWAAAWSRKDVKAYLNYYARDFETPGGVPRKTWESDRQLRIAKPGPIRVEVDDLNVRVSGDEAKVRFRQSYTSANLKSATTKTLVLVKRDGRWLIQQERVGG
ncbi:tetratricopeptide repeat protein [Niveibacterium sp. 24ML]|uniref:nuclear transport factor 2 family protein n=1 Tax=Niveibacterium sp. 24ML TaxID=2985512 RepID=UPI00226EE870|nr:tetratricopeptide repeat protein [Niveibacterium sp. 24ML]MCX9155149.1 tetratricopeptide repeat protein [Niveibacterium sp. 24ML]